MLNIDDHGKIWLRGSNKPEYGVRVGEIYFITGKEDNENVKYFIHENYLLVVFHYPKKKHWLLRRFAFNLQPNSPGTLFNGFTETKHADIMAVTHRDEGVEEYKVDEKDYLLKGNEQIDLIKLIKLVGWG